MSFLNKSQLSPVLRRATWYSHHAATRIASSSPGVAKTFNHHHTITTTTAAATKSFSSSSSSSFSSRRQHPINTVSETLAKDQATFSSKRLPDLLSLKGRVSIFTGGGRGIGLTMARAAAELGSDIALVDVLPQPVDDLTQWKKEFGIEAKYYRADVTSFEQIRDTVDKIKGDFGRVHNCVNAAAIVYDKPFEEHKWDECSRMLDINIMGSYFTAQCAAKAMMEGEGKGEGDQEGSSSSSKSKSIIFIASSAAHITTPSRRMSMYSATKGAMDALTRNLAAELGPVGIRVNSVSPGFIATEMVLDVASKDENLWQSFNDGNPMGRIGLRSEMKGVVGYLLSDAASFTTGADYKVDGGMSAGRV